MQELLICGSKTQKWHNSVPPAWQWVSLLYLLPSFPCSCFFLTAPLFIKQWFSACGSWASGTLRWLWEGVTKTAKKSHPVICNLSAQCYTSVFGCPQTEKGWKPLLSKHPHPLSHCLPTCHFLPLKLLCHLCSYSVFLLTAGDARPVDSHSASALLWAVLSCLLHNSGGDILCAPTLYIILNLATLGPIHPSKSALILAKSHCCYHITASSTLWTASCLSSSGQMLSSLVPTLPVRGCWPSGWKLWKELLVVKSVLQSHSQKWFLPVRVAVSLENGLGR